MLTLVFIMITATIQTINVYKVHDMYIVLVIDWTGHSMIMSDRYFSPYS